MIPVGASGHGGLGEQVRNQAVVRKPSMISLFGMPASHTLPTALTRWLWLCRVSAAQRALTSTAHRADAGPRQGSGPGAAQPRHGRRHAGTGSQRGKGRGVRDREKNTHARHSSDLACACPLCSGSHRLRRRSVRLAAWSIGVWLSVKAAGAGDSKADLAALAKGSELAPYATFVQVCSRIWRTAPLAGACVTLCSASCRGGQRAWCPHALSRAPGYLGKDSSRLRLGRAVRRGGRRARRIRRWRRFRRRSCHRAARLSTIARAMTTCTAAARERRASANRGASIRII